MCELCEAEFARARTHAYASSIDGFSTTPGPLSGLDLNLDRDIVHGALDSNGHPFDTSKLNSKSGSAIPVGGPTLHGVLPSGKGAIDPLGAIISQRMANQIYNTPKTIEHDIAKNIKVITDPILGEANNIQHYIPLVIAGGIALFAVYLLVKK